MQFGGDVWEIAGNILQFPPGNIALEPLRKCNKIPLVYTCDKIKVALESVAKITSKIACVNNLK